MNPKIRTFTSHSPNLKREEGKKLMGKSNHVQSDFLHSSSLSLSLSLNYNNQDLNQDISCKTEMQLQSSESKHKNQ